MTTHLIPMVLVAVMLAFFTGTGGCDRKAGEIQAIDQQLDNCLDADDGAGAVRYLSQDSVARLDRLVSVARTAKQPEVRALPISDRLDVLQIRLLLGRDLLKPIDGRAYYIKLINMGWMGSTSTHERVKTRVASDGKSATVTYRRPNAANASEGHWVFESGTWKTDEVRTAETSGVALRALAVSEGVKEDQILMLVLKLRTKQKLTAALWDPPTK